MSWFPPLEICLNLIGAYVLHVIILCYCVYDTPYRYEQHAPAQCDPSSSAHTPSIPHRALLLCRAFDGSERIVPVSRLPTLWAQYGLCLDDQGCRWLHNSADIWSNWIGKHVRCTCYSVSTCFGNLEPVGLLPNSIRGICCPTRERISYFHYNVHVAVSYISYVLIKLCARQKNV